MNTATRAPRYGVERPCLSETLYDGATLAAELAERLATLAQTDDCCRLTNFALVFRELSMSLGDYCTEVINEGWDAL
jgi:hypothetical protein